VLHADLDAGGVVVTRRMRASGVKPVDVDADHLHREADMDVPGAGVHGRGLPATVASTSPTRTVAFSSRSRDLAAAVLQVDRWRNVFTLSYEVL